MKGIKYVFVWIALISIVGCKRIPEIPTISMDSLSENQKLSLASVKQINEFPFISMDYYGNTDEKHLNTIRKAIGLKSNACTTFTSYNEANEKLLSRNHDWPENPVLILFSHPKNKLSSVSLVDLSLLGYTKESRFSSLEDRLNLLYALYLPMDGMNEKGVAIGAMGCMGLDSKNDNSVVFSTEIIRLILDNAENIDDAIEIFRAHSIHNIIIPLHYLVSDSTGKSAIIEYIDGDVQVQELNTENKVLTNFKYFGSSEDINKKTKEYLSTGKISKDVYGESYLRYIKIKQKQLSLNGMLNEFDSMKLLQAVSMKQKTLYGDFFTVWSVVYNLTSKSIHISIGRNYNDIYTFKLGE